MKILSVQSLAIPDIQVIRFARFADPRGYFTEPFRRSDFEARPELRTLHGRSFVQANESYSRAGVVRGLHFQWDPPMGKLVRTVRGRMVDLVVDLRHGSTTRGRGLMYDMPSETDGAWSEWIWVPPGFAHGNYFRSESTIEYFCTGEYNQAGESGISPGAADIDWSLCEPALLAEFQQLMAGGAIISDKDRAAVSLGAWLADPRSEAFRVAA